MINTGCIYVRVSTKDKQDYQRQIDDLLRLADYKKINITKVFHEKISGTIKVNERPIFSDMIKFIEKENIKHLLVWELSRIGRSLIDTINIVNDFNEKRINIHIKNENLTTLDDNFEPNRLNQIIISILSGFAQMERETIIQRSSSGIRRNVSQGGGGTGKLKPYGFKVKNKKLVIEEEEAGVIKLIFKKYLEGYGSHQIANYLNDHNIPTRYNKIFDKNQLIKSRLGNYKKATDFLWRDATIINILNNTIYKGERRHKNEIFKVPAIIESDIFDRVQALKKQKYKKGISSYKYQNIFKEKIICPKCGHGYFMHKRANGKDNAYKCLSKRLKEVSCDNPSVNIDKLNNAVYQVLIYHYREQAKKDKKLFFNATKVEDELEFINAEKNQLLKNAEKLRIRQKKLLESYLDSSIDKKMYSELNSEILDDIENNDSKLFDINIKIKKSEELLEALNDSKKRELENVDIFKKFVHHYIEKITISNVTDEVNKTNFREYFKTKDDVIVMIEVSTNLWKYPYTFIISRYSNVLIEFDMVEDNLEETLDILTSDIIDSDWIEEVQTGLVITEIGEAIKI